MKEAILSLLSRGYYLKTLLRFTSFDVSTAEGRADERHRRAMLTTVAAAAARATTIGTSLLTVPLTLKYLGTERYGMWMTISSLIAMLSFADFGIGNGILSAVSRAYGSENRNAIREYVTSGIFALCIIASLILVAFIVAYGMTPWHAVFNVQTALARSEAGPTVAVFFVCFALAIPLGVIQRLQMGLQEGFLANLWQCAGSIMALICVLLAIWLQAGLPWLVLSMLGSPLVMLLINALIYFFWTHPEYTPAKAFLSTYAIKQIGRTGFLYFVLQIVGAVLYSSDNIVIAQLLGPNAVAEYSVPQRLFSVVPMLLMMLIAPLWPAYGEAIARADNTWVATTFKRSFQISVGFAMLTAVFLVFAGRWIIHLWVGGLIMPSVLLLLGLGAWTIIQSGAGSAAMILNGANIIRFQVIVAIATAIVGIVLKIILVGRIGVSGAVWSTVIAYLVCAALPIYLKVASIIRRQA